MVSDGDAVFQSHKIQMAGLFDAVDGQVLIYVHKEQELNDIEARYPSRHYVLVDDKLHILSAVKNAGGLGSPRSSRSKATTQTPRTCKTAIQQLMSVLNESAIGWCMT